MFSGHSLFKRTFFLILSNLVAVVTLFIYLSINSQESASFDEMYSKAKTIAKSIALVSSDAMIVEDYSFLVQHNEKVIQDNKEILYILVAKKNDSSTIIHNHTKGWEITDKLPDVLDKMHSTQEKFSILNSSFSDNDIYHFSYPVVFSGINWGWVSIGFSLNKHQEQMKNIYFNSILLLIGTLLTSFIFSYVLTRWLVKPILLLNDAAKQVSSGDFSTTVTINSHDEIGELATNFNYMVNTINRSDEKLRTYNIELEKRVIQRTKELNFLNQELDQRVKTEVHKRAEQEQMLIQQSRFAAMGEMIGNIAHQWRQPLNALGLLLQNIENAYEMDILDEAYIARSVEKGNRLTKNMSQTIDDFRNFFKPNKESEIFTIVSTLKSTMDMIGPSLANNMITIDEDIDESVSIKGFASEFSQVLLNILNNARDALIENTQENRKIGIHIFKDDKKACIEIKDNAGGIPDNIIEKIFDPYFTTKDEGKGTGIGLYMSKTIIENNMHGALSITNDDDGAVFKIHINAVAQKEGLYNVD